MKVGIAVGTSATAEWIELTIAAIPEVEVAIINLQDRSGAKDWKFLIVDGDDPGREFLGFYKQLKTQSPAFSMLVLGSPSSPLLMTIDWDEKSTCFLPKPYQLENLRETFSQQWQKLQESALPVVVPKAVPAPAAKSVQEELAAPPRTQSLGYLSTLRLSDLLQMLCLNQWTGKITVQRLGSEESGEIFLSAGNIVHASCTGFTSEEACFEMLTWGRCEFGFIEENSPVIATIRTSWESIVMEGARRLDEREAGRKTA